MGLFHITTRTAWAAAVEAGCYRPASLDTEGFIHLSNEKQWLVTANRFFRGQTGLVLLEIREDTLLAPLKHEPADADVYPHLYGELNLDAVVNVFELPLEPDGSIVRPGPGCS